MYLPNEAIVDVVWYQMRDYELRGNWNRIALIHQHLFQVCQNFGKHSTSHKAISVLTDYYRSLSITLHERTDQQREMGVLVKLRGDLLHRLQSFGGDGLVNLAKLYRFSNDLICATSCRPICTVSWTKPRRNRTYVFRASVIRKVEAKNGLVYGH
jgi:hypothetical protein